MEHNLLEHVKDLMRRIAEEETDSETFSELIDELNAVFEMIAQERNAPTAA